MAWVSSRITDRKLRSRRWETILGLRAVMVDIGGTIVEEQAPGTPVSALHPALLANVKRDLAFLARQFRVAAATNTSIMSEPDVRRLLATAHIDRYFEVVVTSFDVGAPKPDPAILLVAMERLKISDPEKVLYIGDRTTDHDAALSAGMHFAYAQPVGLLRSIERWGRSNRSTTMNDPEEAIPFSPGGPKHK